MNELPQSAYEVITTARLGGPNAAVVQVQFKDSLTKETYESVGEAKRHPRDLPDSTIGLTLATARALLDLSIQLFDEAWLQIESENKELIK